MATASSVSQMLLSEALIGSNGFESYFKHFELLAELQNWKRTVSETEIDKRPHYFALRSQKAANKFYRTLPEATGNSYDETYEAFRRHYKEKPSVFRGRLARRVQQAGEEFTDFLEDLQQLAVKAYPHESQNIRDHLVFRGFLKGFTTAKLGLRSARQLGTRKWTSRML